jgi:iron complex outermembrane receptor protein
VQARVGQVFQRVELDATGRILSNAPRVLTTLAVEVPVPRLDAVIGFNAFAIGERRRVVDGIVPGAFVGNLSVSRRPHAKGLGVSLSIYNLFDQGWGDPGSVEHRQDVLPQDGRTGIVRLSWRM